jgi:hypothetical protein
MTTILVSTLALLLFGICLKRRFRAQNKYPTAAELLAQLEQMEAAWDDADRDYGKTDRELQRLIRTSRPRPANPSAVKTPPSGASSTKQSPKPLSRSTSARKSPSPHHNNANPACPQSPANQVISTAISRPSILACCIRKLHATLAPVRILILPFAAFAQTVARFFFKPRLSTNNIARPPMNDEQHRAV